MSVQIPISIGNDIVDLGEAGVPHNPRFIERVCSPTERAQGVDNRSIWTHWAAKEAAYKALRRIKPETVFSPERFAYDRASATVTAAHTTLYCAVNESTDYVAAVCSTERSMLGDSRLHTWIEPLSRWRGQVVAGLSEESFAIRRLAVAKISEIQGVAESQVEIRSLELPSDAGRGGTRLPQIYVDGVASQWLLSFSHHGEWLMCSALF